MIFPFRMALLLSTVMELENPNSWMKRSWSIYLKLSHLFMSSKLTTPEESRKTGSVLRITTIPKWQQFSKPWGAPLKGLWYVEFDPLSFRSYQTITMILNKIKLLFILQLEKLLEEVRKVTEKWRAPCSCVTSGTKYHRKRSKK